MDDEINIEHDENADEIFTPTANRAVQTCTLCHRPKKGVLAAVGRKRVITDHELDKNITKL